MSSNVKSLLDELDKAQKYPRLSAAEESLDHLITLVSNARKEIEASSDPHTTSMILTKLQNPVKNGFEKINDSLKAASSTHKKIGKALDRYFPLKSLPTDDPAISEHLPLVNRAIIMHLLREGQFGVAATFTKELQEEKAQRYHSAMGDKLAALPSDELQQRFAEMYNILEHMKARNLGPAIAWARENSEELEARGSTLEFELVKLQYIWLFLGPSVNGLPDDANNGTFGAMCYAKQNFDRFVDRYGADLSALIGALIYSENLADSPYKKVFDIGSKFEDVAKLFTREFCSLLGLSAESPLLVTCNAGTLAVPYLIKYMAATQSKRTEWTQTHEMPFETPLPDSMLYHSIFVCPVSKEQTTDTNPPVVIPCGHMICRTTLERLAHKNSRFKCPYCPLEARADDCKEVIL